MDYAEPVVLGCMAGMGKATAVGLTTSDRVLQAMGVEEGELFRQLSVRPRWPHHCRFVRIFYRFSCSLCVFIDADICMFLLLLICSVVFSAIFF